MDGDLRYAAIREHIAAQHEIARLERSAKPARARQASRSGETAFSSSITAVVGTMRRVSRRALGA